MPKYYRFRPTSPNRKPKSKNKELLVQDIERFKLEVEMDCMGISAASAPVMKWYLRRISWRDNQGLMMTVPRQTVMRTPAQINNQGVIVLKRLTEPSHDWRYFF